MKSIPLLILLFTACQPEKPRAVIYPDRSGWAGVVRYADGDSLYRWTDDAYDTLDMKRILPTITHR